MIAIEPTVSSWIDVADQLPDDCEIVIIFFPPRRLMAQFVPKLADPWNLMEGNYLGRDQVVMWAKMPPHPYEESSGYNPTS